MDEIKPVRLQRGDLVGVITPAGPIELEKLELGIAFLKEQGLKVKMGNSVGRSYGYLGGTDAERLEDLHQMFRDPEIKGIFCARGGYGTARFASQIDYGLIKNNPKIFWGYSDITFLHTAINQHTGLCTFHGPMIGSDLGRESVHPVSKQCFSQLFEPKEFIYTEELSPLEVVVEGYAEGPIVGGNLTLAISTMGTKFEIDTTGKLFLIEDINEEPRAVDRMLNQLLLSGKLQAASGIIIGDFCNCTSRSDQSLTLDEVINYYVRLAGKPAIKGFKIGHCNPNIAIPLGVHATLNTSKKKLTIKNGVI
ncbi:S66 peptidase family protein [Bacillus sp. JJ1764]|uniref:S66 peptidase family protein n=1 Tax=Bacillus sp. JJ1764 TaxID=3122964 RepID=UPI002FFF952F